MTALEFLGYLLLTSLLAAALLLALTDIARRAWALDDLLAFCAAVLLLGVLGYLCFWLAYLSYPLFGVIKIALLAALLGRAGVVVYRRRLGDYGWLAEPLLYTFLFFVIVMTLGFSNGGLDAAIRTAQNRFSHELPGDNLVALVLATAFKNHILPVPLIGDWLASDRPPLQTGLYLLLDLRMVLKTGETGYQPAELSYQVVAAGLQATYLFGVWAFAVAVGLNAAARRLVLLACCLLPTAIINTFFVWPKMLAVGYVLLVFTLLFCRAPRDGREDKAIGVLAGGLAALAVLSHGTSFFVLIGIAATVVVFWAWPAFKTMIFGVATFVLLYAPWIYFQRVIDPPGTRLMKWHLAGVVPIDSRGLVDTLRDSYSALSWHDFVQGRLENFSKFTGPWPNNLAEIASAVVRHDAQLAKSVRAADFFHLLPSLHVIAIAGILAVLLLPALSGQLREQRDAAARLLFTVIATCVAYAILMFIPGSAVNHQGSYAVQVMAAMFAVTVLAVRLPIVAGGFVVLQAITVAAIYVFGIPHASRTMQIVCAAAALALFAYTFTPLLKRAS